MTDEISVSSGEVNACKGEGILRASAIGSCVVVTAYDPASNVGGMAHVMLPGSAQDSDSVSRLRYAENSIEEMMGQMKEMGTDLTGSKVCLVGGGNVLGDGHDSPGLDIVQSLTHILNTRNISPVATEIGGMRRRSCSLDVARGRVTYTIGDSAQRMLWESGSTRLGQGESAGQKAREDEGGVRT